MNAILGARIRNLRESRGLTQEQIADKMNCTRQKYARMEKGLIDISYSSLIIIAQALEINLEEITSSVNHIPQEQLMFRGHNSSITGDKFQFITEMIDTFYAHRKLYHSVRQVDVDE